MYGVDQGKPHEDGRPVSKMFVDRERRAKPKRRARNGKESCRSLGDGPGLQFHRTDMDHACFDCSTSYSPEMDKEPDQIAVSCLHSFFFSFMREIIRKRRISRGQNLLTSRSPRGEVRQHEILSGTLH